MKSLSKVVLLLLAPVLAVGLVPDAVKADNPITKPKWSMPKDGTPGNATGAGNCNAALVDSTGLAFGNCFSQNTLFVRLTGARQGTGNHPPRSLMYFAEQLVEGKLLKSGAAAGAATFSNFLDLTLKRFLDGDTATTIDYNPTTYLYRPVTAVTGPYTGANRTIGLGGYEASPLLDRTCLDIPLVGSVCLNGYLYDVDNEVGQVFFTYGYDDPEFDLLPQVNSDVESGKMTPNCTTSPPCGIIGGNLPAEHRDDDDGLQVRLKLDDVKLDLFFEPPTDVTGANAISDIVNNGTNYEPSADLSTYLKAYGKAHLGTVELILNLRVAAAYNDGVQPHAIGVGFELQDVFFDSDFQFVFQKGPYCNNNLGTTETPAAGATFQQIGARRPFGFGGTAMYPGLISDTSSNANPGPRLLTYYAQTGGVYPHVASAISGTGAVGNEYRGGGSGTGRDRIGVGARPYEYNDAARRWSDHPLNCKQPADACNLTAAQSGSANTRQDGGPEWSGVTNTSSCEWPNKSNNGDDSTYKISEQITAIIPYIQGEIKVIAEDKFKNRSRGNPGYYLGPTSLLDLGATLAGISFDWPLRPGTDYVFIDALLDSDVDADGTNEFWADNWGVMMPFNFALGVSWNSVAGITAPINRRLDRTACVQDLGVLTGFRDGFGEFVQGTSTPRTDLGAAENKSDDPFLTKTFPNKGLKTLPAGMSTPHQGLLAGFGFPGVVTPGSTAVANYKPAGSVLPGGGGAAAADAYALGFALHQNVLSAALYDAVIKGLLCMDLDASGQAADVEDQLGGEGVADLLNTATFQLFFPALYDKFPDRPMRVRVVPLLKRYTHNSACDTPATCPPMPPGGNGITTFSVTSEVNKLPHLQSGAEAPYVIMGGPPIGLSRVNPASIDYEAFTSVDAFGKTTAYIYPDLSIVIPNLLIEFYVFGTSDTDNNWYRVFAVDLGAVIGLNIDIVSTPTTFTGVPTPVTGVTYYPIGCDPRTPAQGGPAVGEASYCSGGSAYTKRVLRLAGLADPEINAIIEYSELTYGQTGTEGTNAGSNQICGDNDTDPLTGGNANNQPFEPGDDTCTGGTKRAVNNAFDNPAILKAAISNLIGLALSVDINAIAEIGFDLGAFLNIPLAIDAPYIGPSYVVTSNANDDNATDLEATTANGFGDYLVGGLSFDLSALSAGYLIQQIDYILDGTDSTKPFGLELSLAPGAQPTFADQMPIPQATIQAPVKVSAEETVFRFAGYDAIDGAGVRYSWRVDNGVWSVFSPSNEAVITGLLEGKHTIEVKAINSKNMMQDVPARYTFVVDSIAPKVRVVGDRTVGGRASFFVEASDWLTPKEDVRIAYKLDDGRWSNFSYNKKISVSSLREGRHTLRVRASDNAGNTAETAFNFSASDGGFGCSTAPGAGSLADVLVMLVIPALVILRKRLF